MNADDKTLIEETSAKLKLLDIALVGSHFARPEDFPGPENFRFSQLEKRVVRFFAEERGDQKVLLVKIDLGVRLVDNDDNERVFTQIEADYMAIYLVESPLSDAHFKAFSEFNSLHNVWPFWRQHVFDIVQRGRLPTIDIPLMAGKRLNIQH